MSSQVTERVIAPHDGSDLETVESSLSHSTGISEPDTSSMQSREDQVTDLGCPLLHLILNS